MRPRVLALSLLALLFATAASHADPLLGSSAPTGFSPQVPVSAFARPLGWFDPAQLHISTSVSVGSGFSGGTNALQVTSLSYQFAAPLWLSVGVGNAWGPSSTRSNSSMFLEGLDLQYQPFKSMHLSVSYRDFRSPLQLNPYYNYGFPSR